MLYITVNSFVNKKNLGNNNIFGILHMKLLNTKGLSLVYVMLCLIIIGITTTALIRLSHKHSVVQLQYSNSESARLAVQAGFDNAISFLESSDAETQQKILAKLQQWVDMEKMHDVTDPWIVGSAQNCDSLTKACKFKVQLLGFDTSTFAVTLHSEGVGKGRSKASAIGTYIIEGLGFDKKKSIRPTHALYLGSGADEINTPLTVNGSTFMNKSGKLYKRGHVFNGEFRRYANGSTDQLNIQGSLFQGPALFEDGNVLFSNTRSLFRKGLGISANTFIQGSNAPIVQSVGLFLNGPVRCENYNGNFELADIALYAYGDKNKFRAGAGYGLQYLHSAGEEPENDPGEYLLSPIDLHAQLGIEKELPPTLVVDLDKIRAHHGVINYSPGIGSLPGIAANSNLTGGDLNALYTSNSNKYYKDEWLILNITQGNGSQPFNADTTGKTAFTGKMILIVEEASIDMGTNLYNSSSSANTFIYIGSDEQIINMGGSSLFRGFIYCNSTYVSDTSYALLMQSVPPLHVRGSIYCVNEGHFRLNGYPSSMTISYDDNVLDELADLDIFIDPNDTSEVSTDLVIKAANLRTELLSRSF